MMVLSTLWRRPDPSRPTAILDISKKCWLMDPFFFFPVRFLVDPVVCTDQVAHHSSCLHGVSLKTPWIPWKHVETPSSAKNTADFRLISGEIYAFLQDVRKNMSDEMVFTQVSGKRLAIWKEISGAESLAFSDFISDISGRYGFRNPLDVDHWSLKEQLKWSRDKAIAGWKSPFPTDLRMGIELRTRHMDGKWWKCASWWIRISSALKLS